MKNCHHPARSQSALQTSGAERDGNEYFFCPHIGITFLLREHMQSIWHYTLRFAVRRLQICILITASATASRTIGLSCCVAYTSVYKRIVSDSSRLHGQDGHCKLYLANINKHLGMQSQAQLDHVVVTVHLKCDNSQQILAWQST